MHNSGQWFVAFLDILGFAACINELPSELDEKVEQIFSARVDDYLIPLKLDPQLQRIRGIYREFHECLEKTFNSWRAISELAGSPLILIDFSDSCFILSKSTEILIEFVRSFMSNMYVKCIPVRGGIGYGSFAFDCFTQKILSSERYNISCRFLGSGIVRAYYAESCGLKGLRVFMHSSSTQAFKPGDIIPLPEDEATPQVTHELNLIPAGFLEYFETNFGHFLKQMALRAPSRVQEHYFRTARAIERMLAARGMRNPRIKI